MATPITTIDSPNISVVDNQYIINITGSGVNQDDINYLLSAKYSFTGSLVSATANGGVIGFGYGIAVAPTFSISHPVTYPVSSVTDFKFYLNGVRIDDSQVVGFSEGGPGGNNTQSTASFNLGYSLRNYDVITGEGKFKV